VDTERVGMLIYDNNTTDFPTTQTCPFWHEIQSPGIGTLDWIKVLCLWKRHFTFTVLLPNQEYRPPYIAVDEVSEFWGLPVKI